MDDQNKALETSEDKAYTEFVGTEWHMHTMRAIRAFRFLDNRSRTEIRDTSPSSADIAPTE